MTTVSAADVLEAIKKNGYEHYRGGWFNENSRTGRITKACILGQAAINLNVSNDSIMRVLNNVELSKEDAEYLESKLKGYMEQGIHVHSVECGKSCSFGENDLVYYLPDVLISLNDGTSLSYEELTEIADHVISKYPEVTAEVRTQYYEAVRK